MRSRADWLASGSRIWREARRSGWTTSAVCVSIGWRAPDAETRRRLAKYLAGLDGFALADADAYEPENDPRELIAVTDPRRLTRSEFDSLLEWAAVVAKEHDAVPWQIGIGRPGAAA